MDAPAPIALELQRPLPDDALMVCGRGAPARGENTIAPVLLL